MRVPNHLKEFYPKADTRVCLQCNKKFTSLGPHNRICGNCKHNPRRDLPIKEVSTKDLVRSYHLTRKSDNA